MKKLLFALASLVLLSGLALASVPMGVCQRGMALDKYGHPAGGAQIRVCSVPYSGSGLCSTPVQVFSDVALTIPLTNPPATNSFASDMQGNYQWCATGGTHYVEQVIFVNQVFTDNDVMLPVTKEYVDSSSGAGLLSQQNTWTQQQTFGAVTYQNVVGKEYLVSKYASIQAAINAAVGSGQVTGVVIDDRTTAYTGAGFNLPDSVTVQLAPVTYTISATVTFNNGNNNVTAGIILQPGAHLLGQSTSTNHGTIIQPANGLNADLIATSTVGTGTTNPQWWHWGEIGNLRLIGNGANQTAGDCLKIENMGETARVHDIELSACYSHNLENIGYAATQSAISNISSNRSVNGAGVAFTNLSGVALINGISGDCNQLALISANFNAAGTLTLYGLKSEAEASICPAQVQDPVILSTTGDSTVLGAVKVDGGYAFGTSQHDFVKSTGPGTIQFQSANFYLIGYTNILNDTVRGQVIANVATTTKQPVFYLSNGVVFGNQAFTFQPNTFMQGNPNGTPTELFGLTSSSSTLIADAGNGDNSSVISGGILIYGHNRTQFGSSPEAMARWGYRWLGPNNGYDTSKWDLIPAWNTGDTTEKNIGNTYTHCQKGSSSVSCRWSHVYAVNVDAQSVSIGTYTVSGLPSASSFAPGTLVWVSNGVTRDDCSVGGGGTWVLCEAWGANWYAASQSWLSFNGTIWHGAGAQANFNAAEPAPDTGFVNGVWRTANDGNVSVEVPAQQQSDWNESNTSAADYIKNKPTIPVQGSHVLSGSMQGPTSAITGTGSAATVYSYTIPANTFSVGMGVKCFGRLRHTSGSSTTTVYWKLDSTSFTYPTNFTTGSGGGDASIEIFTPSSLSSEVVNIPWASFGGTTEAPNTGLAWTENLANASTIYLQFSVANTDQVKGDMFWCQTIQ